ncbi:MAG: TolC family protein [Vibrionaceae bacterium]
MKHWAYALLWVTFTSYSAAIDSDFSVEEYNPEYNVDVSVLFTQSMENSYKVNANRMLIESEQELLDAANYYYLPSASINSEIKKKMLRPGHPLPYTEFTLDLSAKMKLWSNTTGDTKKSAIKKLSSVVYSYNESISEIYSIISLNLAKIELSREFIFKSKKHRKKMDELLKKMDVSSASGLLKKSDRLFAEVSIKKFEESMLNVQSQIEQYKNQINNITPISLYKEEYGISSYYINDAIKLDDDMFNLEKVIEKNFSVLAKRMQLESDKAAAEGSNEYFNVDFVTQHGIKEHKKTSTKNEQNQATYGYTYDNDGSAYFGLKLSFNGLNYSQMKSANSELKLYAKKMIEFDQAINQIKIDLQMYKQQYELLSSRLKSIDEQLKLTVNVISNLFNEMTTDESSILDVFRNISSMSDLEMNRLSIKNELLDLASKVRSLNSMVPQYYVIQPVN